MACSLWLAAFSLSAQEYDTISNWDGIVQDWHVSTQGSAVVSNPAPDGVNSSAHCFKFITSAAEYDYMYYDMDEPANFDNCPRYRLKVLAPASGGNITLKFENYNNSFFQEIVMTPVPGQWTDIEYDFSGLIYNDFFRMVIFPDFQGTASGKIWYIDDVLREACEDPGPLQLETNLPIVVIDTYGQPIVDDPKITAHMGIIDNGPGEINSLEDPFNDYDGFIGIEIRGQSSQMFPKKSYGVETRDANGENLNVSLLGLPKENDWVFYAPYTDKSMLRNVMSFEMGRRMGHYASRSVFFEMVINGEYKGVYTLMEKIKRDKNRVNIAEIEPGDISGDELTGGYIIKVDKLDLDFQYNVDGWKSYPNPPYPNAMKIIFQYYYPEPEEIVSQQRACIRNYITNAENTLTSTYFQNPDNGYQSYFDVPSFIDFMLLNEITKEVDKYRYSNYMYKERDSDGGKLFAGPLWDFDLGYGNVDYWAEGLDHTGWLYAMVEPNDWSIIFWWKRLMEDSYFKNMAKSRWIWLRENRLSDETIHGMIDSITTWIAPARERNFERWPILGTYVWPNYDWAGNDYEDEVDYFENFLFPRLTWMDQNVPGQVVQPTAGISSEDDEIRFVLYGDFFSTHLLKPVDFQLNNAPAGVTIRSVDYNKRSECTLYLSEDIITAPDMTVTVKEAAVNYWLDITSSPLSASGIADTGPAVPVIRIYSENSQLHIRCDQPEFLPEKAEVINLSGQHVMTVQLQKNSENTIRHNLNPGLYLFCLITDAGPLTVKFVITDV